jgi:hypothetical protein
MAAARRSGAVVIARRSDKAPGLIVLDTNTGAKRVTGKSLGGGQGFSSNRHRTAAYGDGMQFFPVTR